MGFQEAGVLPALSQEGITFLDSWQREEGGSGRCAQPVQLEVPYSER